MTFSLQRLIKQASKELVSDACKNGHHDWETEGGRSCPKEYYVACSQTVYVCRTCGETDYGYKGGPGYNDCYNHCHHSYLDDEPNDN